MAKNNYTRWAVNKKNKYASQCGASGGKGKPGFQPGNTCGGDGDGRDTSADKERVADMDAEGDDQISDDAFLGMQDAFVVGDFSVEGPIGKYLKEDGWLDVHGNLREDEIGMVISRLESEGFDEDDAEYIAMEFADDSDVDGGSFDELMSSDAGVDEVRNYADDLAEVYMNEDGRFNSEQQAIAFEDDLMSEFDITREEAESVIEIVAEQRQTMQDDIAGEGGGSTQDNYTDGKPYLPTSETSPKDLAERLVGIKFTDKEDMAIHMVNALGTNENVRHLENPEVIDAVWEGLQEDIDDSIPRGATLVEDEPSYNQDKHDTQTGEFIDDLLESRDKRRKSTDPDNLKSMVNKIAKENWDSETGMISSDIDLYDEIKKASKEGGLSLNGQEIMDIQEYMEDEIIQTPDTGAGDSSGKSQEATEAYTEYTDAVVDDMISTVMSERTSGAGEVTPFDSKQELNDFLAEVGVYGVHDFTSDYVDEVWDRLPSELTLGDSSGMSQEAIDAYKDISHEDINDMLAEKDITQEDAELMRKYVDVYNSFWSSNPDR